MLLLRGADLSTAASALHADADGREKVTGYQGLRDLDVIDGPDGSRLFVRGDTLALVYVGGAALPAGLDHADLVAAVGSDGDHLRSRQGKTARLHVVAEDGIAWSEENGQVAFVEIFPPTSFEDYTREIYVEPPAFNQ
ncbi:hypothetical protein ACPPVS_00410 [Cellulomonas sp. McL0617]|uniref:hypothetical protein n=1 Tax=Cellulomonas sp. McL0617 TaxID=3415675 RepID=UPI003CF197F8